MGIRRHPITIDKNKKVTNQSNKFDRNFGTDQNESYMKKIIYEPMRKRIYNLQGQLTTREKIITCFETEELGQGLRIHVGLANSEKDFMRLVSVFN